MRLTAELIQDSLSYLNPLKERELDLRGQRIPVIENLGAAASHDAIDFTDNDIQVLGNFPLSPRITTLLLARNRVARIQPGLAKSLPNLTNLVLTANALTELVDVDMLVNFPRLTQLVLVENPLTKKEHYRYWVLWRIPTLRFLDYEKVKQAEREKAGELFGTAEEPTALAHEIMSRKPRMLDVTTNGSAPTSGLSRMKLTDDERLRLQERIEKSTSLQEIFALEKELQEGRLPAGIEDDDAMQS